MGPRNPKSFWRSPYLRMGIVLTLLVGGRGAFIASALNGRYLFSSFVFDFFAATVILAALQFLDFHLSKGLKKIFSGEHRMASVAAHGTRLLFVVMLFGTFLLATAQMHPPKVSGVKTPEDFGVTYSEHFVETSDGIKLSVWAMPTDDPSRPVVVVTHGLGANKQNFMPVSELIRARNYHVVAFDFRGHGDSGGHTCSLGVTEGEDIKAVHDFAKTQFPSSPVYAWSTSLGAAATLRAAAKHQVFDKLVVDATFSSVEHLAMSTKFRYLGPLGHAAWHISRCWYLAFVGEDIQNFSPEQDIANVSAPVFLVHGTADTIIPHEESLILQEAAAQGTELWLVNGAGHSASFHHPSYLDRVVEFFDGSVNEHE